MDGIKLKTSTHQQTQIVYNSILHCFIALTCFLLSYAYWFPSNHFVFVYVPNMWASLLKPKCLFIVVNVIVVLLVGESKFVNSHASSRRTEIYDEYVERRQNMRGEYYINTVQEMKINITKENVKIVEHDHEEVVQKKEVKEVVMEHDHQEIVPKKEVKEVVMEHDHQEVVQRKEVKEVVKVGDVGNEDQGREGDDGLPAEELNKRVEEFIARVNRQRRLEALDN
ncbi:Zinc finger E-box-binding homeobox 1 [Quillaja saponaria]|uniref:Zinc finger E-box-binding homeobox 1 n=1 Tax=Quillaja saponaria TaxID=32244 RepID=A0AAD7PJH7_QUISA|nr:Zinc finger E-box-binding homeobox 1 [Quillaja saponaria]